MKARSFLFALAAAVVLLLTTAAGVWWAMARQSPLRLADQPLELPRAARFVPRQTALSLHWLMDPGRLPAYAQAVAPAKQRRAARESVQQLRDGVDNFFATFIECLEDVEDIPVIKEERPGDFLDGFLQGTRSALTEGGRQNMSITMRKFDARRLGALIGLFERAVGLYGELVNINAYHQPGVEAGKKAAADVLDLQSRVESVLKDGASRSVAEIRQALGEGSDESVFWIMRHLTANKRGYTAEGDWASPASMRFSKA